MCLEIKKWTFVLTAAGRNCYTKSCPFFYTLMKPKGHIKHLSTFFWRILTSCKLLKVTMIWSFCQCPGFAFHLMCSFIISRLCIPSTAHHAVHSYQHYWETLSHSMKCNRLHTWQCVCVLTLPMHNLNNVISREHGIYISGFETVGLSRKWTGDVGGVCGSPFCFQEGENILLTHQNLQFFSQISGFFLACRV